MPKITLDNLLGAYAQGVFPMSEDRHDPTLFWVSPNERGVLPLDGFYIPKRLQRTVKSDKFAVSVDQDFAACLEACAASAPGRRSTWINDTIMDLYMGLHKINHAHSVECRLDGRHVGGLYGVSLKGAFFGESMFSLERDASKVALVHLVGRLKAGGYTLLDAQFVTDHLAQFGAIEIVRSDYLKRLKAALAHEANFYSLPASTTGSAIMQSITQTS